MSSSEKGGEREKRPVAKLPLLAHQSIYPGSSEDQTNRSYDVRWMSAGGLQASAETSHDLLAGSQ